MTKSDKKLVIKQELKHNVVHHNAKIIPFTTLTQMIVKRDFEEDTSRSSLKSAAHRLIPFAVPELSNSNIDRINKQAKAIKTAATTTVKDVMSAGFEFKGPQSFNQLTKVIKQYGNLLHVIFGRGCPLFLEVEQIQEFLEDYGDKAIQSTSVCTMVTIVWILHMQSRHFAAGLMTGKNSFLPILSVMSGSVQMQQPVI